MARRSLEKLKHEMNAKLFHFLRMQELIAEHLKLPRAYIFSDLGNFKHEISHYVWDFFARGDNKGLSKDKPRKHMDHLMNCMQYIAAMRPRGGRARDESMSEAEKFAFASGNSYTAPA
jgi:hypothetical protein